MKDILCFGDSNTWGSVPNESRRYNRRERWPALLQGLLPTSDYQVIEEGLEGRTTIYNDPFESGKNGLEYLGLCLRTHLPDLVIILLGTNDLKSMFGLSASDISRGAARLVEEAQGFRHYCKTEAPQVLLVAPPPVKEIGRPTENFDGAEAKSLEFARHYAARAQERGCHFFDAGTVVESCPFEGIHWQAAQHKNLAEALASRVVQISL